MLGSYSVTPELLAFLCRGELTRPLYTLLCVIGVTFATVASLFLISCASFYSQNNIAKSVYTPNLRKYVISSICVFSIQLPFWIITVILEEWYIQKGGAIFHSLFSDLLFLYLFAIYIIPTILRAFLLPLFEHPLLLALVNPHPIRQTFRMALKTWKLFYKHLLKRNLIGIVLQILSYLILDFIETLWFAVTFVYYSFDFFTAFFSSVISSWLLYKFLYSYICNNENMFWNKEKIDNS